MKYSPDPRPVWATELGLMFGLGFLLASVLWLSLWFFRAQPSQAAVIDEKESELSVCQVERQRFREQAEQAQSDRERVSRQLRDAQIGWGRCLREKNAEPGATETAANKPD